MEPHAMQLNGVGPAQTSASPGHGKRLQSTQDFRRVIEEHLVDDTGLQRRPIQLPCFPIRSSENGIAGPQARRGAWSGPCDRLPHRIPTTRVPPGIRAPRRRSWDAAGGGDHGDVGVDAGDHALKSSGMRSVESATIRSRGRLRSIPVRSVSRQSSERTVPMPVRIASALWRISCTCARARSLVIQPELSSGAAILPSRVSAAFNVTSGSPVCMA